MQVSFILCWANLPLKGVTHLLGILMLEFFFFTLHFSSTKLPGFTPLKHTPTPLGVKFHAKFLFCDCEINLYSLLQIKAQINIHSML
jgi:hypothetical protein